MRTSIGICCVNIAALRIMMYHGIVPSVATIGIPEIILSSELNFAPQRYIASLPSTLTPASTKIANDITSCM